MRTLIVLSASIATLLSASGCDEFLAQIEGNRRAEELKPEVESTGLELRASPSLADLGSYYCPRVIDNAIVALGCSVILGPPPPRGTLTFDFGVTLTIHNPNNFPVPALNVLVALTLYPNDPDASALGAICITMCGDEDAACDPTPAPGACDIQQDDITSLEDLVWRVPGLIADIVTGQAEEQLRNSVIIAGGDITLDLTFSLGIDEALNVFEKTAAAYVDDLLEGRNASLIIPVSVDGTVFFKMPYLGRIGVGYGPLETRWEIL